MPKIILGVSSAFCAHFLRGQVKYLVKHGYEVVIISGPGEEIEELADTEGAKLLTIPFTKKISPITDLNQLLKIIRILKTEKPDLINAGNPKSGFLILLACYMAGYNTCIFTLHGLVSDSKNGLLRWMISITEKISCSVAKKVIVVSNSLKIHAEKRNILSPGKGMVIENGSCNGIDLQKFSRTTPVIEKSIALKEKYGLTNKNIVICFIGRLTKDKGIDILFEAFNRLTEKYSHLKLLLAGPIIPENPFSPHFVHQLNNDNNIIYTGKISDIAPIYLLADILVLPSYREGFPNVLIEAAAMGVPVIASNIPGCIDAVKNGYNGELFEKGNTNDLTTRLEKIITDSELRVLYSKNGQTFVKNDFASEKIWAGQLSLYENLLANA